MRARAHSSDCNESKRVAGILTIGCGSLGNSIWKLGKCITKTDLVL